MAKRVTGHIEMGHWLRALAVLPEDLSLSPTLTWGSQSQDTQYLLLASTGIAHTWGTEIHTKTHTHKIKNKGEQKEWSHLILDLSSPFPPYTRPMTSILEEKNYINKTKCPTSFKLPQSKDKKKSFPSTYHSCQH